MKKKLWAGIFAAALTFSIGATNALAAAPQSPSCPGYFFVDENGDGICDNFASGLCGGGRRGGLNQGKMSKAARRQWHISSDGTWVRCADADGDGVCDTCGMTLPLGAGAGFVDADGDGVCDNYSAGTCRGGYCGGAGRQGGGRGGRGR